MASAPSFVPTLRSQLSGTSRQSFETVIEHVQAALAKVSLSAAHELFGVLRILDDSAALRRALTDPAREPKDKTALLASVLAGKTSAQVEEVLADIVQQRWSEPRDICDTLETVAATVAIAVAENTSGGSGLEELENELFAWQQVVVGSHDLQRALSDPQASTQAKVTLALRLVPQASDPAKLLITQAVTSPRGARPEQLIAEFAVLAASRQKRWIAAVEVSRPLSAEQQERLAEGLNKLYGRALKVTVTINPELIGGVRVGVGDEVVDATVGTRLAELSRKLAS